MQNLTLAQVFGSNASQSASHLTILKSDLIGINPETNNRGEQLLVALLLKVVDQFQGNLTTLAGQIVTDNEAKPITYNQAGLYEKMRIFYWKRQFITRSQQNYTLDSFVIEIFFTPPPTKGSGINLDLW